MLQALVKHLCISLTVLTDFCVAPVTFHRKLCNAFKKAAIEDDGATKIMTSGEISNRLLRSSFDRIGMAMLALSGRRFHRESNSQVHLQYKCSMT